MERRIKLVTNKFSSHEEAEKSDEDCWREASPEQRLDEWSKLFDMYCFFHGIKVGDRIKEVVKKTNRHAI